MIQGQSLSLDDLAATMAVLPAKNLWWQTFNLFPSYEFYFIFGMWKLYNTTIIHLGVCVHLAKIWQITPSVTPSPTSLIAHFMWHFLKESRELAEKIFQPPRIFLTGRHSILSNGLLAISDNLFAQKYLKLFHFIFFALSKCSLLSDLKINLLW